jgi:hypothetical protein
VVVLAAILGVCGAGGVAHASKKRTVVVLDFEGAKRDRFHAELVKLLKKTLTVMSTDKWNGTAEELEAATVSDDDLRTVARRLQVDAIVEGRIEKRNDEFIIRLKLHDGHSGKLVGSEIHTKTLGLRIDSKAERDIKDELVEAIEGLESGAAVASEVADDGDRGKPVKRKLAKRGAKKSEDDAAVAKPDDDDRPARKPAAKKSEDDDPPVAKKLAAKAADDEDQPRKPAAKKLAAKAADDEDQPRKPAGKKLVAKAADDEDQPRKPAAKKLAAKADDDEDQPRKPAAKKRDEDPPAARSADDAEPPRKPQAKRLAAAIEPDVDRSAEPELPRSLADPALAVSVGQRALDVVAGVSFTARTLAFTSRADLAMKPADYKGTPVAGAMLEATLYPLALSGDRTSLLSDLGVNVAVDRVLKIESKNAAGMVFATTEQRLGFGVAFRHAFGSTVTAPVALATFDYSSQEFSIANTAAAGIPSVKYAMFEPGLGLRLPVTANLILGLDAKVMLITNSGDIQQLTQYGTADLLGFEGALAVDYLFTRSVFARAAIRYETIGHTFQGNGAQANGRDGDATTTDDVSAARDSYVGGFVTLGYAY